MVPRYFACHSMNLRHVKCVWLPVVAKYYYKGQIKKDGIGRACSRRGIEMVIKFR